MTDYKPFLLQQVLTRLTILPVFVAALMGWLRFRRFSPNLRYLAILTWFVLPLNVLGFVLMLQHRSNLFLMPAYAVGEFWLLALVFRETLRLASFARLMPWLVGGFAAYALFDSLRPGSLAQFRPGQQVIQSVLILMMVGLYFRKLLRDMKVESLRREPMFWVAAGLLIYCLGYLQIAIFSNYLLRYSLQLNVNVWAVHSLLFITLYCCYSFALWLPPQK